MVQPELRDILHALLFVADAPLSVQTLCEATGEPAEAVEAALRALQAELAAHGAIQLVALAGGYQLATKPEYAFYIARLLNPPQKRLSRAALETLAIIAYEQPVTQAQIDALRGVGQQPHGAPTARARADSRGRTQRRAWQARPLRRYAPVSALLRTEQPRGTA
jgi:segregation and condensation protein B